MTMSRSVSRSIASSVAPSLLGASTGTTDLVMTVAIASDGDQFDLKANSNGTYDCTVAWGDGSTDAITAHDD